MSYEAVISDTWRVPAPNRRESVSRPFGQIRRMVCRYDSTTGTVSEHYMTY